MKQINVEYFKINNDFKNEFKEGFIEVFKKAFAGAPYFESYQNSEVVSSAWDPHLNKGCIYLAANKGRIIGLGCCLPLNKIDEADPNISALESLLSFPKLPFTLESTCYMSELAVLPEYRNFGIGTELIKKRLSWAKENNLNYYVMRTAAKNSNSLGLYLNLGAKIISDLEQDVSNIGVISASKKRIFLFGQI